MSETEFVRQIAELAMEGECLEHGPDCAENGEGDDCEIYEMSNDFAWSTLNGLIEEARRLEGSK